MPSKFSRKCSEPRCNANATSKGKCDDHQPAAGWYRYKPAQESRHKRGYGSAWERIRLVALRRDKYLCQSCLAAGRVVPAKEVDHVVPKALGGTDDLDNLQSLCTPCHTQKTIEERVRDGTRHS